VTFCFSLRDLRVNPRENSRAVALVQWSGREGEPMPDNNQREILENLISTCKDGETGYLHAASQVKDPELKDYFTAQSAERTRLIQQLEQAAERLGSRSTEASGTVAGALHRAWFEIKGDIGLGDEAILESVEQGEDAAKKAYQEALSAGLAGEPLTLVQEQANSVRVAHDRVRDWRDRLKNAA
jgi:uncharacterized protein (TIGR02284 family)